MKKFRVSGLVVTVLLLLAFVLVLPVFGDSWVVLGTRDVRLSLDRDEILVTAARGEFKKVKFGVRERGVRFYDVTVVFGSGESMDIPVRAYIPAGEETRVFDLPGPKRTIRKIVFLYETRPGTSETATVVAWGLRD
jgi:hypothetical protein